MDRLNQVFKCVHVHGNNAGEYFLVDGYVIPNFLEVTLINKNFFELISVVNVNYPNILDAPCLANRPEFPFMINCDVRENNNLWFPVMTFLKEDRIHNLELINQLVQQLNISELDRASRLVVIEKLAEQLKTSEEDRANRLVVIEKLMQQLKK